jgi:hypothetical protein
MLRAVGSYKARATANRHARNSMRPPCWRAACVHQHDGHKKAQEVKLICCQYH